MGKTHGSHEAEVYGLQHLKKYDLTIQDVMNSSYKHYQRTHGGEMVTSQSILESLMRNMNARGRAIALPVCRSAQIPMNDYRSTWKHPTGAFALSDKHLPCTCGDWRSNETALFINSIGLGLESRDFASGLAEKLYEKICPRVRVFTPLTDDTMSIGKHVN